MLNIVKARDDLLRNKFLNPKKFLILSKKNYKFLWLRILYAFELHTHLKAWQFPDTAPLRLQFHNCLIGTIR